MTNPLNSMKPDDGKCPMVIAARPAHIMLGNGVTGVPIAVGNDASNGSIMVATLGPEREITGVLDSEPWSLCLCQWDDTRSLFVLDAGNTMYDQNTPVTGDWSSWEHAINRIFSNTNLPKADRMNGLILGNFRNLSKSTSITEAMFYLVSVAYDVDRYESLGDMEPRRVLECMMDDYRLIDPESDGLDAVEATTVKAYGRPMFYDLDFSRLAGRWTDWERDLKRLGLPSSMWLVLRRATGLLGKVDRSIVVPVVGLFIPSEHDLTRTIMTRIPSGIVEDWLGTMRDWVKPDAPGSWADESRFEWVNEFVKLTNIIVYKQNPWGSMGHDDSMSLEVENRIDGFASMMQEDLLCVLVDAWAKVLVNVFYPSVEACREQDSDALDELVRQRLESDDDLHSTVLALISVLVNGDDDHDDGALVTVGSDGGGAKDGSDGDGHMRHGDGGGNADDVQSSDDDTVKTNVVYKGTKDDSMGNRVSDAPDDGAHSVGLKKSPHGSPEVHREDKCVMVDDAGVDGRVEDSSDDGGVKGSDDDAGSMPGATGRQTTRLKRIALSEAEPSSGQQPKALRRSIINDDSDDDDMVDWSELVVTDDDSKE